MPSAGCPRTISLTALRNRSAFVPCSRAGPSPLFKTSRSSGGRGRLPAWVVRTRSTLCFIVSPNLVRRHRKRSIQRHMRGGDDVLPAFGFLLEVICRLLRRTADRFCRKLSQTHLHLGIVQ